MAQNAMARQLLPALRRQIAAIEGALPQRLAPPDGRDGPAFRSPASQEPAAGEVLLRRHGTPVAPDAHHTPDGAATASGPPPAANRNSAAPDMVASGAAAFDRALGGGFASAALCEIHGRQARDAGAVSGFALALASLARRRQARNGDPAPLLWIGAADLVTETGLPHAPAIAALFAIPHEALLLARADRPLDALWIAGEAAGLAALSAVIVEIRGNPSGLDLTATRRLQRRARAADRPVFLLRTSATSEPTAAPVRLRVAAAPASPRQVFGRPLPRSIGPPAFDVTIEKCRAGPGRRFILEWNDDEHRFRQRRPQDSVAVVPVSGDRQDHAPALRPLVARRPAGRRQAG